MFEQGLLGKYEAGTAVLSSPFFTLQSARDRKSMRPVTLKVYTPDGVDLEAKLDRLYRKRPLCEMLGEIHNPAIVKTLECGDSHGKRVEILEPLLGTTLRARLEHGRPSSSEVRSITIALGEALVYLHSIGILHRGLSPDAVMIAPGGEAKIADMSLVMDISHASAGGTVVGPVGYTAPEVIARRPADAASDVYSLGALVYEMLAGRRLHANVRGYEGLLRLMNSKPIPLSERNPLVSPVLEAIVMKAVERKVEDRYQTVEAFLEAFAATPLPDAHGAHAKAFAA